MADLEAPVVPAVPASTPAAAAPVVPAEPASPAQEEFFSLSEEELSKLPPEIRQTVVDPLITKVKSQVGEKIKARDESFKPIHEKAKALDKLIQNKEFQKWWNQQNNPAPTPTVPAAPKPGVSTEEWNMAYEKAAGGDLTMLNQLQEKNLDLLVQAKYAPVVQAVQAKQRELEMTMEMNDLFTNHPDAKELDSIRMDPSNQQSPSLLEFALHYVSDKGGRPFEEAYQAAAKMSQQMKAQAKQVALGMVNDKKISVTETPKAANVGEESVIYVDSPQEALRQQIQATLKNQNVTYRVKSRQK